MKIDKKLCFFPLFVVLLIFSSFSGCVGSGSPPGDSGLRIITEEFYPFNYLDENDRITGQSTEVVAGILDRLNQKANIEMMPWSEGYNIVLSEPGGVLYSATRTDERENLFKWVGPVASYDYMLYAKNGSGIGINSLEAAKKVGSIVVVRDDARHQFLEMNGFENLILCEKNNECLNQLMAGKAELWLGSSVDAERIAVEGGFIPLDLEAVYPVRSVEMYLAFNPATTDDVINKWQDALDSMKRDGTYDNILLKYGTISRPVPVSPVSGNEVNMALLAVMSYTDGRIKNILRPLEVIALTDEAGAGEWSGIKPLLKGLEEKEPNVRIWYAHPNGTYYTIVDDLASANLMSRPYFPVVLSGNESVGTVVVSHSTGRNAAIAAVPVKGDDTVTGVLGASIYMDDLTDTLRNELPAGMIFYAIDREGKFALHSEKGMISQDITMQNGGISYGRALMQILSEDAGTVEYEYGGKSWNAVFRTSPLTGWRFVVAYATG